MHAIAKVLPAGPHEPFGYAGNHIARRRVDEKVLLLDAEGIGKLPMRHPAPDSRRIRRASTGATGIVGIRALPAIRDRFSLATTDRMIAGRKEMRAPAKRAMPVENSVDEVLRHPIAGAFSCPFMPIAPAVQDTASHWLRLMASKNPDDGMP